MERAANIDAHFIRVFASILLLDGRFGTISAYGQNLIRVLFLLSKAASAFFNSGPESLHISPSPSSALVEWQI